MPNLTSNTGYWNFNVNNVFDNPSLSSYALSETPLRFVFNKYREDYYSSDYVLWDFGDGSPKYKGLSAEHYYYYPGEYKVTCNLMLSSSTSVINTFSKTVTIKDFIPNTFAFRGDTAALFLTAGIFSDLLTVDRFNSLQSYGSGYSFFLNASGSNSLYYDRTKAEKEPYSFLLPTHRFVQRKVVGNFLSDTIIDKLSTVDTKLYGRLDKDNLVVPTSASDSEAFFVGTSGYGSFNYVDDTQKDSPLYLFASIDTENFPDNYSYYNNIDISTTLPVKNANSVYYTVSSISYKEPEKLSITSNGLDGEGFELTTFNINNTKFKNSPINFVVKTKYNNNYDAKYSFNKLGLNNYNTESLKRPNQLTLSLVDSETFSKVFELSSYVDIDNSYFDGYNFGFLKGNITIPQEETLFDNRTLRLSAAGYISTNEDLGVKLVEGMSTPFTINNSTGVNKVAKINENIDYPKVLHSYAKQPTINQSEFLFNEFFGTIFGTLSSNPNSIGKKIYEKTSNFVSNNSNIDLCNVSNLFSFANMFNLTVDEYTKESLLINYPADLSRLVDIFSIKKSLLFGRRNQAQNNFLNRYNLNANTKSLSAALKDLISGKRGGQNLGTELYAIQTNSDGVRSSSLISKKDKYIVARETFSGVFTLVPTDIKTITTETFSLSDFSSDWGWGLSLPSTFTDVQDLSSYYEFYRFNNVVPGRYVGNTINWDDRYQTTINLRGNTPLSSTYMPSYLSSYQDTILNNWENENGVIQQNLTYQLLKGYQLLSATS